MSSDSGAAIKPQPARLRKLRVNFDMFGLSDTLARTLVHGLNKLLISREQDFDAAHGTKTNLEVSVEDGDIPDSAAANAERYVATRPEVLQHICRTLPISHEDYIFVDMGSGRGRTLLLASHFPFKRVVGVEISPQHHRIALDNIAIYRSPGQQCLDIQAVCLDCAEYEFPQDNLIIYLYQPFLGELLMRVLDNIAKVDADRYSVFLCLSAPYNDTDQRLLRHHDYLQHLEDYFSMSYEHSWVLYGNSKAKDIFSR